MKKFLFLVSILGVSLALSSVPASAALIDPFQIEGNPSCFDLPGIPTACDNSLKVEPVVDGTYYDNIGDASGNGPLIVTLDVDAEGIYFDWASNDIAVCAVIVKGGPNANVYDYWTYEYPFPVTSDTGLSAPVNPFTEEPYGLSHVEFCYGDTAPVPEPATMLLLGAGLIGLGALGRKKFFKEKS